jgi:peptidoglycan/LPS O-acetylase OafA/YrhL
MQYRADIDGLRGGAVLLVLLFHAGLPFISGGFIGVDIFFVISGYLITSIIVADAKRECFSYLRFYERRARRILPAMYVMAMVVLVVTLFVQVPSDLLKTAKTLLFAVLFSSNVFFWRTTDYFSGASDFEFFLHTWSLGVEEQFYFIFPLVILLFVRRGSWLLMLSVCALIISFVFSVYTSYYHEWASYYLLPSRAWQMMMGAVLAIASFNVSISARWANSLGVVAALLILVPAFYYSKHTRFPGVAAMAPTVGAALLIFVGSVSSHHWVGRCLSSPLMKGIGLISYSLYLWHWPVFAFLRNYQANIQLDLWLSLIGIVVSLALAYVSWKYIEAPFRDRRRFTGKSILLLGICSSVLILFVCASIIALQGIPSRIDPKIVRLSAVSESGVIDNPCMKKSAADIYAGKWCLIGDQSRESGSVAFWGDSHLGALKLSMSKGLVLAERRGVFFGKTGCPPLLGVLKTNASDGEQCLQFNEAVLASIIKDSSIESVVMHARWALSVEGTRYGAEKGPRYILSYALGADQVLGNAGVVRLGFERTVTRLQAAGKKVVIVASVPEVGSSVPKVLVNNLFWGKARDITPRVADFQLRQAATNKILRTLHENLPSVRFVYPAESLCDDVLCHIALNGEPLYFDDDHLSDLGADMVVKQIMPHL